MRISAITTAAALAASMASTSASATDISLQFGFLPSADIEVEDRFFSDEEDGDGLSLQGAVTITSNVFMYADYYTRSMDDIDLDFDNIRIGAGYAFGTTPFYIGAGLERYKISSAGFSESESGFGVRGGMHVPLGEALYLTGELGYTALDDASAADAALGLGVNVTPQFSLFIDYRVTVFEPDDNPDDFEITVSDTRLGGRFTFGI